MVAKTLLKEGWKNIDEGFQTQESGKPTAAFLCFDHKSLKTPTAIQNFKNVGICWGLHPVHIASYITLHAYNKRSLVLIIPILYGITLTPTVVPDTTVLSDKICVLVCAVGVSGGLCLLHQVLHVPHAQTRALTLGLGAKGRLKCLRVQNVHLGVLVKEVPRGGD